MLSPTLLASEPPHAGGRPALQRVAVVINGAAGSVGPGAQGLVERIMGERGLEPLVLAPEPGEVEAAVREAAAAAPDLLVILAGDGTARLAAEICGASGPLIAPLPGGTLNMLPRALYGDAPWREVLAAVLDHGVERPVCGGRVGGHAFYVAAILGSPALWGHAREAVRAGRFAEALRRMGYALRRAFHGEIHYRLDRRRRGEAEALILISPAISKAMRGEAALEAAVLEVSSAQEVFRLAFHGLVSDWRHDPGVTVTPCQQGRAWARRSIPAILDGEVRRLGRGVEFAFEPCAFRALAPPPVLAEPAS